MIDPKAKVLTDAELERVLKSLKMDALEDDYILIRDHVHALKAELALKDKVVEAAQEWKRSGWSPDSALKLNFALSDLDKVMAR